MVADSKFVDAYTDFGALNHIKNQAQKKSPAALKATAQQFEALFLQTMLKSMRDSVQSSGLFNSSEQDLYSGLFDQQIALNISKVRSIGIADTICRQLSSLQGVAEQPWKNEEEFIAHILPSAKLVSEKLGIPTEAILSVAALETGWGNKVIQHPEGGSSFNLFGIKADAGWKGSQVSASTLEFSGSAMESKRELFRSYGSAEESISDFALFLKNNPRYSDIFKKVSNAEEFFNTLQKSGYATDPVYASKLSSVLNSKTMQQTLKKHDV